MSAVTPDGRRRRWLALAIAGAGLALFIGANAHLIYVAIASQPGCVAHSNEIGGAPGRDHDYRAAKSAC